MASTRNKRNSGQIERDRRDIAGFYLRGWLQIEICKYINADKARPYTLSKQQISYDLGKIQEQWRDSALMDLNEAKLRELARIDQLERTYWTAWEKSCDPESTLRQEGVPSSNEDKPEPIPIKIVQTKSSSNGNPAFLRGVQDCIKMRIELLGLDAPIKHDVRNYDLDMSKLTDEQLRRVAAGEDPFSVVDGQAQ